MKLTRREIKLRKELLVLCQNQTDYTETAHLPEHHYTNRYLLHRDKLYGFIDIKNIRKAIEVKYRKDWEYTVQELKDYPMDRDDELETLADFCRCDFDTSSHYCNHQIIINFNNGD